MPAYELITIGAFIGMIITLLAIAVFSKRGDPDPDRREYGQDRRKRHNTRVAVRHIAAHHQDGALTTPQAVQRLREIEAPATVLSRCA